MFSLLKKILMVIFLILPCYFVFQDNFAGARHNLNHNRAEFSNRDDQGTIFVAFRSAMKGETPVAVETGYISTGYIAMLGFYHRLSGLWSKPSIEASFAYHGLAYAMAAAFLSILLMFRVALRQTPAQNRIVLAAFCATLWIGMYQLSVILRFSFIPWSHYSAAFCGIAFVYLFIEAVYSRNFSWHFAAAFFGILFFNVRRHEAMAVFFSCAIALGTIWSLKLFATGWRIDPVPLLKRMAFYISGIILAFAFIYFFSNRMPINGHYSQLQSYHTYVEEYMRIYPKMIPLHLLQTFVDPNYYSFGNEYAIRHIIQGGFDRVDFAMPLLMQLPILFYAIPFALFAFFVGIFTKSRWHGDLPIAGFTFIIGVGSFVIITLGYNATAVWGGVHNKYGLVREFILAVLLLTIATGPALLQFVAQSFNKKHLVWIIPLTGISILAIGIGQWLVPGFGLFNLTSRHLNPKPITSTKCVDGKCNVSITYADLKNQPVRRPFDENIIKYRCGASDAIEKGFTLKGNPITIDVATCEKSVSYEVYALFTGYCGTGLPNMQFSACPSRAITPNCK